MGERGRGEADCGREATETEPAKLGVTCAQFRESRCEPAQTRDLRAVENHKRKATPREEGARASRERERVGHDDVRRMDREHEAQEVMVARAGARGVDPAERADLPGVEGHVLEDATTKHDDEQPRVTTGRMVFDHRGRMKVW